MKFISVFNLIIIIVSILYCNCGNKNNFDLNVSFKANKPFYQLKCTGNTYTGTNIDTLTRHLWNIRGNADECYRTTESMKCYEYRIHFACLNDLKIETFYNQWDILYCVEGSARFDISLGKNIIHARANTDSRGVRSDTVENKMLKIFCDTLIVTIFIGKDTIFTGNYDEMQKNFEYDANIITVRYYRNGYPIVTINPKCNLTFNRIFEIANRFKNSDRILFTFEYYFQCMGGRPVMRDNAGKKNEPSQNKN